MKTWIIGLLVLGCGIYSLADVNCGGGDYCPNDDTCCKLDDGSWGCCPLIDAVCCTDGEHCCPSGTTCDSTGDKCDAGNGQFVKTVKKQPAIRKVQDVQCDSTGDSCADGQTCCQLADGSWGCCPEENAVCCDDHEHCCPENTKCTKVGFCVKSTGEEFKASKKVELKTKALKDVQCDSTGDSCDDGQTCCQLADGSWGCCPEENAVCCDDHEHCCPENTKCTKLGFCVKSSGEEFKASKKVELKTKGLRDVQCDSTGDSCSDGQTCCQLADGSWGCCPISNAVCCDDHVHCCPEGTTCDVSGGRCKRKDGTFTQMVEKTGLKTKGVKDVQCDSTGDSCADGQTCCQLADGSWGCCPEENAVCCDDHEHCCPENTKCTKLGFCVKSSGAEFKASKKVALKKKALKDVKCDDSSSCSDGQTCCQLADKSWGCCPISNAVCCSDHVHCCPEGTTCDVSGGRCNRQDGTFVNFVKKQPAKKTNAPADVQCDSTGDSCADGQTCCQLADGSWGCCPEENAVCCDDHEHCCPENTKCTKLGFCVKSSGAEFKASKKVALKKKALKDVKCDDSSSCSDGQTCCQLADKSWGCCPISNAVCCDDHVHCCPEGTTCDVSGGRCNRQDGTFVNFVKKQPAKKTNSPDVQCAECESTQTCCKLPDGSTGCCPLPNAVCCSDEEHCCPNGTTCDVSGGKCNREDGTFVQMMVRKVPGKKIN